MKSNYYFFLGMVLLFLSIPDRPFAQALKSSDYSGLKFRNIGPALTSGRIADIAIHPNDESTWYVAVGSGGVWKTSNNGTTWKPIFDAQSSYSIGCVTIDPSVHSTVWVGTGENVGGRHVGFGDGVYKSTDEGKTWTNMGLKLSEHISKIIVHPNNSNIVWVAAQGPLWSKGGERGVYKTIDGGKTWKRTLSVNEWTGATDLLLDPENPEVLYAATWQRHRSVANYLGSGPGSGLHKSTDGGLTWKLLTAGLPTTNMGKIGLAMSPFDSKVIYAAIEEVQLKGGLYITENAGATWKKNASVLSGGTGPHYYQELYASPHHQGKLFFMNNEVKISDDHGKTFYGMNEKNKHVDSHAMAFKASDPNYVLFGTDGGLYESHDLTQTWRFIPNLPLTQYYKVAVDDSAPFYNVYGGTQDNGSHGGPSRTTAFDGIQNRDWWITLGWDGHQSATEPGNPDITYGEFQEGWLWRIDQTTMEKVFIQPQPEAGDPYERFNWDAPILVSPHNSKRIYFASYRVWQSNNRGDDWEAISEDLTRNEDRFTLPMMGQQQGWDNAWDVRAMSTYNTITSLAESPLQEGLLYAGTDDGIIQVSEDAGAKWRKIDLGTIKGVPARAFVNDVRADLHDPNVVFAVLDNHKTGDFRPYVIKSTDKGRSWQLITGNLPSKLLTWRIVQDHVKKDLLFLASEFGVYFTPDGGSNWTQLKGGLPTISVRDITIQKRENDLVLGTFGRGIYILDDYSPLRKLVEGNTTDRTLFEVKDAWWYVQREPIYGQGDDNFRANNPEYGAVFTYYLKEAVQSAKEKRKEKESKAIKAAQPNPFPGWEILEKEQDEGKYGVVLVVRDASGAVVNVVKGSNKKGVNRVNWALNYKDKRGERKKAAQNSDEDGFFTNELLAGPGTYSVALAVIENGELLELEPKQSFEVKPLGKGALPAKPASERLAFVKKFQKFQQKISATFNMLNKSMSMVDKMQRGYLNSEKMDPAVNKEIEGIRGKLILLEKQMQGMHTKNKVGERSGVLPYDGVTVGLLSINPTTYGPTGNHKKALERAEKQLFDIGRSLEEIYSVEIPKTLSRLEELGAPWIER